MDDSDNRRKNKRRTPYWIFFILAAALITGISSFSQAGSLFQLNFGNGTYIYFNETESQLNGTVLVNGSQICTQASGCTGGAADGNNYTLACSSWVSGSNNILSCSRNGMANYTTTIPDATGGGGTGLTLANVTNVTGWWARIYNSTAVSAEGVDCGAGYGLTTLSNNSVCTKFYLDSNPSGYTSNTGTVTSVLAGDGLQATTNPIVGTGTISTNATISGTGNHSYWNGSAWLTAVSGSGSGNVTATNATANYVMKASNSTNLVTSSITDNGTNVSINSKNVNISGTLNVVNITGDSTSPAISLLTATGADIRYGTNYFRAGSTLLAGTISNSELFRVIAGGFGINTSTASRTLDVNGTFRVTNGSSSTIEATSSASGGRVSVNGTAPTSTLDVTGNASFSGNLATFQGLFNNDSQVCTAANGLCTGSGTMTAVNFSNGTIVTNSTNQAVINITGSGYVIANLTINTLSIGLNQSIIQNFGYSNVTFINLSNGTIITNNTAGFALNITAGGYININQSGNTITIGLNQSIPVAVGGGGGSPGGSAGQIQYNNGGFAGSVNMSFNNITNDVSFGGDVRLVSSFGDRSVIFNDTTGAALYYLSTTDRIRIDAGGAAGLAEFVGSGIYFTSGNPIMDLYSDATNQTFKIQNAGSKEAWLVVDNKAGINHTVAATSLELTVDGSANITKNLFVYNTANISNGTLTVQPLSNASNVPNVTIIGSVFANRYSMLNTDYNYFYPKNTEYCINANGHVDSFLVPIVIASGTASSGVSNASHPCVLNIVDSTTGSGGIYANTGTASIGINGTENGTMMWKQVSGKIGYVMQRFGFMDSITLSEPTDGCFFTMYSSNQTNTGNNLSVGCANNGVTINASSNYTYLNNTWYILNVFINATSNNATFSVYNESGKLLWNNSVGGTTIPTLVGRETGFGYIGVQNTTDAASTIANIDFIDLRIERKIRNIQYLQ